MTDNFGLLLKAIILEPASGLQVVAISAEGVPHQRQVEATTLLALPDMGELVDEKTLAMQRLAAEILGPEI